MLSKISSISNQQIKKVNNNSFNNCAGNTDTIDVFNDTVQCSKEDINLKEIFSLNTRKSTEVNEQVEKQLKLLKEDEQMLKMYKDDYENNTVNGLIRKNNLNNNIWGTVIGGSVGFLGTLFYHPSLKRPSSPLLLLAACCTLGISIGFGVSKLISKIQADKFNNPENNTRKNYFNDLPKVIDYLQRVINKRQKCINDLKAKQ